MVGRHPRRLEVVAVDEITSAIRCNRPCDCWHVIEDIKLKLHNLCSRFVLGDLMPKSFVLSAKFGRAPRVDFQGGGEFCLLRRCDIRANSDSGLVVIGPVRNGSRVSRCPIEGANALGYFTVSKSEPSA
jgi:hypothetical protein